ncbi:MAG: hypothetical protein AAF732_06635 [Pseudomonadota bacterium]
MHGRHDHRTDHDHNHNPDDAGVGPGHNHHMPADPAQWQTPHHPGASDHDHTHVSDDAKDLDLVETAFVDGFSTTDDPTSFLRLACVPFAGADKAGTVLRLLRVEQRQATDVGSLTPQLGGGAFQYRPLPAALTSRRHRLAFVYFDGHDVVELNLADARELQPVSHDGTVDAAEDHGVSAQT